MRDEGKGRGLETRVKEERGSEEIQATLVTHDTNLLYVPSSFGSGPTRTNSIIDIFPNRIATDYFVKKPPRKKRS